MTHEMLTSGRGFNFVVTYFNHFSFSTLTIEGSTGLTLLKMTWWTVPRMAQVYGPGLVLSVNDGSGSSRSISLDG